MSVLNRLSSFRKQLAKNKLLFLMAVAIMVWYAILSPSAGMLNVLVEKLGGKSIYFLAREDLYPQVEAQVHLVAGTISLDAVTAGIRLPGLHK